MSVESPANPHISGPDRAIVGLFENYLSKDVSLMTGVSIIGGALAAIGTEDFFHHEVFPANPAHVQAEAHIKSLTASESKVQSAASLLKSSGNTPQANNLQSVIDSYKTQIASTRATMPKNPNHGDVVGITEFSGSLLAAVLVGRGVYMAARHRYRKIARARDGRS